MIIDAIFIYHKSWTYYCNRFLIANTIIVRLSQQFIIYYGVIKFEHITYLIQQVW